MTSSGLASVAVSVFALSASEVAAQSSCNMPDGQPAYRNSDTNVAFVEGYFGSGDPTLSYSTYNGMPWVFALDKCFVSVITGTQPYWKYTCMDDGEYVVASNYGDDATCTSTPSETKILNENSTLAYNCGTGTTEAYVQVQILRDQCDDSLDTSLRNLYTAVGVGMCGAVTQDGYEFVDQNSYCDWEGSVYTSYKRNASAPACGGEVCIQTYQAYGVCGYVTTVYDYEDIDIFAKPLDCVSAEMDLCRDGTGSCQSTSPTSMPTSVPTKSPTEMPTGTVMDMTTTSSGADDADADGDDDGAMETGFSLVAMVLSAVFFFGQ